jgi:AAA15 family ATPase/GTPase
MRSAFDKSNLAQEIRVEVIGDSESKFSCLLQNDNQPYSKWIDKQKKEFVTIEEAVEYIEKNIAQNSDISTASDVLRQLLTKKIDGLNLHEFLIYSPDIKLLRTLEKEAQIQPLGLNGEGLFKLLKVLSRNEKSEKFSELKSYLRLIGWFEDFEIPQNVPEIEKYIRIKDRYLDQDLPYLLDQNSSNEGFLFLLFYFSLFISDNTPKFFAIDNIDESLNPKLCSQLIKELVTLCKKYDKQVILTTHNAATLDGLNLHDDEQRLFVVSRNKLGHTKARRILKPKPIQGQEPVRLSEAFLRGYIGGLPKSF